MSLFGKLKLIDTDEGKEYVAYKWLYKGFSYSVKFSSNCSWKEPTCCVHCGRNYGLDRNTIRGVLPMSLTMTPIVSYWEEDIVFTYVLHPMFSSCTNLTEIRIPSSISRNGIMEQQLEISSNYCKHIIDYLDFLDHPERMYA